jgi:ribokinase
VGVRWLNELPMPGNARIVVLGNACLDTTYHLLHLPNPGDTLLAERTIQDLGGKGLIQAIAARRAGAEVTMIAAVGVDAIADRIRDVLVAEEIQTDAIIVKDGPSDSSTIMLDENGENCIVSSMQQAQAMSAKDFLPHLKLDVGDVLLLQGNLSRSATLLAITHANRAGATVAVNLAPLRNLLPEPLDEVDIAIANVTEAMEFASKKAPEEAILGLNASVAVVTLGRYGCLVRQASKPAFKISAPKIEVRDSTGAGDVFVGTFIAEWLATKDAATAATLAVHAASDMVTRFGTVSAIPDKTTIDWLRSGLRNGS